MSGARGSLTTQYHPSLYDKPVPLAAVSLRRCLRDHRRDPISGVPLGPASAALRYLVPVYDLEQNTPPSTHELQRIFDSVEGLRGTSFACHVTGSSIERLSVPPYTERAGDALPHYRTADVDVMLEMKPLRVAARRGDGSLYMDTTRASHRGYTRVVLDVPGLTVKRLSGLPAELFVKTAEEEGGHTENTDESDCAKKVSDENVNDSKQTNKELETREKKTMGGSVEEGEEKGTDKDAIEVVVDGRSEESEEKGSEATPCPGKRGSTVYLSIDGVNTHLASQLQELWPGAIVHRQGPAINIQELMRKQSDSPGGELSHIEDYDLVPALPLAERPAELADWLERVRGRQWPSEQLRQEMESSARCFLVGAGHASSSRRDLEWRLSFSEPERRLALSLTPQQRKVYVLIKMMQKCYLQEPKVLVTYHIKTLMFWELEKCADTNWIEEELFERVLAMLDRIATCLERHYIPSYFMPDNNLISHADAGDVAAVLATVQQIRRRPLQHLYGIDDRFRFDFSPPRPLSELHAPLRELLMAEAAGEGAEEQAEQGAGEDTEEGAAKDNGRSTGVATEKRAEEGSEAAEALVLSLISQAQSEVHRGVVPIKHYAHLLRDAWEALAAAGPEGAPHPVHDDWVVFAAAAAFTSMEADESAHLTMGIRMAVGDENRPPVSRTLTEGEAVFASEILPTMFSGAGGMVGQLLGQVNATGQLQEPAPAEHILVLRNAQLELLRDIKNRAQEGLDGSPPMAAAITSTRLQLALVEMLLHHQLAAGASLMEAQLGVFSQTVPLTQRVMSGGGGAPDLRGMINQVMVGLGVPAEFTSVLQASVAPDTDELCQQLAPSTTDPSSLAFEKDPRITSIIPLDMINVFHYCTVGPGLRDEEIDVRYTTFFNMMGFFLKHRRYLFAFRTVGRMTCLRLAALEAEMKRSVYPLNRAQLYLQQLPGPVRALLRLSSGRAAIGVVYSFIDFMNLTFDWALMTELTMQPERELDAMRKTITDATPFADDDVQLTHQLLLLPVLRLLGRDTADFRLTNLPTVASSALLRSEKT
ncbi:Protein MB21D2 [Amphibalanus amphitrite]|uniref:Protein MB21D2 n=1 Tax=Amphibalanus amphitrite TaxID=1232801 RepID=A0A6A4V4X8_AMPAM|nr:Protein MB21D2 [Amphibalanus amphitrite]